MPGTLITPNQSINTNDLQSLAALIPATPQDRLRATTWQTFQNLKNRFNIQDAIIDIHYHAFTNKHIPRGYLRNTTWLTPGVVRSYLQLLRRDFYDTNNMTSAKAITDQMFDIYQNKHVGPLRHIFGGLLLMDMERAIDGGVESDLIRQIEDAEILLESRHQSAGSTFHYKDYILPFLALDPHNPGLFELFCACFIPKSQRPASMQGYRFNAIFQGVKVYPSLGYLPYHPALMQIFEICEDKRIPVTAHCGGIRTHPSKDQVVVKYVDHNDQVKEKTINIENSKVNGKDFSSFFVRPEHWERVLNKFPNLKLNIAHMGNNQDWVDYRKGDTNGTVQRTFNLIKNHNHVYADLSYSFYRKVNVRAIFKALSNDATLARKVMYGSDYYMCQVEKGVLADYYGYTREVFDKKPDLADRLFVKNAIDFLTD